MFLKMLIKCIIYILVKTTREKSKNVHDLVI